MRKEDLKDKKYSKLTVVEQAPSGKNGHASWLCKCECGNSTTVLATNLKSGHTTSCGCANTEAITKHGLRKSPEYQSWKAMIQRCTNPNAAGYEHYGGRGISVCPEWLHSFAQFFADMGMRPDINYSLDRKDNDKGYSKDNCRWATSSVQNNNRRRRRNAIAVPNS